MKSIRDKNKELEQLRKENERLKEAIEEIKRIKPGKCVEDDGNNYFKCLKIIKELEKNETTKEM